MARKVKLPEHLAKILDTPAKRARSEKIMAQGRKREKKDELIMAKKVGCPSGAILRNGRCIKPVYDKRKNYYVASFVGREIKLETFSFDTFDQATKEAIKFMKKDGRRRDIIIHDGVMRWEEVKSV